MSQLSLSLSFQLCKKYSFKKVTKEISSPSKIILESKTFSFLADLTSSSVTPTLSKPSIFAFCQQQQSLTCSLPILYRNLLLDGLYIWCLSWCNPPCLGPSLGARWLVHPTPTNGWWCFLNVFFFPRQPLLQTLTKTQPLAWIYKRKCTKSPWYWLWTFLVSQMYFVALPKCSSFLNRSSFTLKSVQIF